MLNCLPPSRKLKSTFIFVSEKNTHKSVKVLGEPEIKFLTSFYTLTHFSISHNAQLSYKFDYQTDKFDQMPYIFGAVVHT